MGFAERFDYISPTWLDVVYSSEKQYFYIRNNADIEQGALILKLKTKNPSIRIVPRLELSLGDVSSEQFNGLLLNPGFLID